MDIARRIITLRTSRKITTNKLANMAGISQSYLRESELGNKNPTVEILSYICDALNISLKEFFTEEEFTINPILVTALGKLSEKEQLVLADLINELKNCKKTEIDK